MPIIRRFALPPRRSRSVTVGVASIVAFLAIPAGPATAATAPGSPRNCVAGDFSAHTRADLARITLLDPGPLADGLPSLAGVHLATAEGTVDSTARPYRSIASGRHADARVLGLPAGGDGARHAAPGRSGPVTKDLVAFQAAGLATAAAGRSTAHATWDDRYRCGRTGPLTRSATMLGGLSVLDGSGGSPAMRAGTSRTSLLRIGPAGSTQSATDLVRLGNGRIGVRAGAGVSLGDLSLFAGTPQEVSVKILTQPTLEVVAGGDRASSAVTYRPAAVRVTAAGRPSHVLEDAGAVVSLGVLGGIEHGSPVALEVRVSLGGVEQSHGGRQVRAEAASLRVEVKRGMAHLLDVALGHLSVAACVPAPVPGDGPRPRGGDTSGPSPVGLAPPGDSPAPPASGDAPPPASGDSPAAASPGDSPAAASPNDSPAPASPADSPAVAVPVDSPALPSPSASTPVAVTGPTEPSGGTGDGDLALTGADVTVFGFAGAGLILAGLISLLLTRRRPTRR